MINSLKTKFEGMDWFGHFILFGDRENPCLEDVAPMKSTTYCPINFKETVNVCGVYINLLCSTLVTVSITN